MGRLHGVLASAAAMLVVTAMHGCGSSLTDTDGPDASADSGGLDGQAADSGGDAEACGSDVALGQPCDATSASCALPISCTGGTILSLVLTCRPDSHVWDFTSPSPCDKPGADCHVPDRIRCEGGYWQLITSLDPPLPCPEAPPTGTCQGQVPTLGFDPPYCGYPCAFEGGSGWMVVECTAGTNAIGEWVSGACK